MNISRRQFLSAALAAGFLPARAAPTRGVIDAHAHFWDPARLDYPWLAGSPLGGAHLPADYFAAVGGRVEKVVFVQAECRPEQALAEVDWVTELAGREPRIGAIVAFAPVNDPRRLPEALDQLRRRKMVRGIRYLTQGIAENEICARPEFVAGVKEAGEAGLIFEAGARQEQLAGVAHLAAQCPKTRLALDHMGNPTFSGRGFDAWAEAMTRLAVHPNVHCKISGAMERVGRHWTLGQIQPAIEHALDCFGPERVMWGSDWPVCLEAGSPSQWLATMEQLTKRRGAEFQRRLFEENARAFFKL